MIAAIVLTLMSVALPATLFVGSKSPVRYGLAALCLISPLSLIVYWKTGVISISVLAAMGTILMTLLVALLRSDARLYMRVWAIAGSALILVLIFGVGLAIGKAISQGSGYEDFCLPPTAYACCPPNWARLAGFALDFGAVVTATIFGLFGELILILSLIERRAQCA